MADSIVDGIEGCLSKQTQPLGNDNTKIPREQVRLIWQVLVFGPSDQQPSSEYGQLPVAVALLGVIALTSQAHSIC